MLKVPTFTDVSEASGIAKIKGRYGLTPVAADFDEDGCPDIFVACDTSASLLLMNNHDGTFREEGVERGADLQHDTTGTCLPGVLNFS